MKPFILKKVDPSAGSITIATGVSRQWTTQRSDNPTAALSNLAIKSCIFIPIFKMTLDLFSSVDD